MNPYWTTALFVVGIVVLIVTLLCGPTSSTPVSLMSKSTARATPKVETSQKVRESSSVPSASSFVCKTALGETVYDWNFALVTTANSNYYLCLLTLISSIHEYPDCPIEHIYVFDLGMTPEELSVVRGLDKVEIILFPETNCAFPDMMEPKQYAWKFPFILHCSQFSQYVLWMDAGAKFLGSPTHVFDILVRDEIFLVSNMSEFTNREWTSIACRHIMQATEEELDAIQLSANIAGFKSNGKYKYMLRQCVAYSMIRDCVFGEKYYSDKETHKIIGHRHDQSIASILSVRHNCPTNSFFIFGECHLERGLENKAVIYAHRGQAIDYSHLQPPLPQIPESET